MLSYSFLQLKIVLVVILNSSWLWTTFPYSIRDLHSFYFLIFLIIMKEL